VGLPPKGVGRPSLVEGSMQIPTQMSDVDVNQSIEESGHLPDSKDKNGDNYIMEMKKGNSNILVLRFFSKH